MAKYAKQLIAASGQACMKFDCTWHLPSCTWTQHSLYSALQRVIVLRISQILACTHWDMFFGEIDCTAGFANVVEVVHGKIEELDLAAQVDILVSEPMGTLLVNERMLETYLFARDRYLKQGGRMFPVSKASHTLCHCIPDLQVTIQSHSLIHVAAAVRSTLWHAAIHVHAFQGLSQCYRLLGSISGDPKGSMRCFTIFSDHGKNKHHFQKAHNIYMSKGPAYVHYRHAAFASDCMYGACSKWGGYMWQHFQMPTCMLKWPTSPSSGCSPTSMALT